MTDMIAQDVVEQEFQRFIEAMDIDIDPADMDAEDIAELEKHKKRLYRALARGNLVINDNGEAVYTPAHPRSRYKEPITFRERTGASLMAMDGKKKNHDVAKTYAVMADMCKVHQSVFAGLVGSDVKVCEALFALLMD